MTDEIRVFRLQGDLPFIQAVDEVDDCLRLAREDGRSRVLVDLRGLTGFAPPDLLARVGMVRRWAATAGGRLAVAIVCQPDFIDGERFGVVIARSLGFEGNVFEDEKDALYWLEETPALWSSPPPEF